jgi:hypothetical protein
MKSIDYEKVSIYIDVDETITKDMGQTSIDNSIEIIKRLSDKVNIFIWSQGGHLYSEEICIKFGLNEYVCACLPKPQLCIDDLEIETQWTNHLYPNWGSIEKLNNSLI